MSDESRKFWKESIGVRAGVRRPAPTGPTTGAVGTAEEPREDRTRELADGRIAAKRRASRGDEPTGPVAPRGGADLTVEALGRLSIGSSSFAQDVEKQLWSQPTPEDLRALAAVAGERHRIPDEERRRLAVAAVGIRVRVEGLIRALARPVLDATILQARAVEWARLTRLAVETRSELAPREDDDRGVDVLEAARSLLPATEKLEAEARLAAEIAATVDAVLSGRAKDIVAAATHVPDIDPLVSAIRERKLRPGDGLYIEALAAGALARRVLEESPSDVPLAGRIIRQVLGRFERIVNQATSAHTRDPQSKARLAAWLRFMRDMKSRIDETISRPTDVDTGPVGESAGAPRASLADPESERIVVRHLRQVRQSAIQKGLSTRLPDLPEPAPPEERKPRRGWLKRKRSDTAPQPEPAAEVPPPTPQADEEPTALLAHDPPPAERGARSGGRVYLAIALLLVLAALGLAGAGALLPRFEAPIPVEAQAFSAGFTLLDVRAAGALIVATADPTWDTMPLEERRVAAERLMSVAESKGFRAGVLLDPAGRTLALWSPGREPLLR